MTYATLLKIDNKQFKKICTFGGLNNKSCHFFEQLLYSGTVVGTS